MSLLNLSCKNINKSKIIKNFLIQDKMQEIKIALAWILSALLILWNSWDVLAAKKQKNKKYKSNTDIYSIYDKDIPNFQEIELQKAKNLEISKQKFINELKKDWFDLIKLEDWKFKLSYQNIILNIELQEFKDFELAINLKELIINLLKECWTNKSCKFKNNKGYWLDIYLDSGSFFKEDTEILSQEEFLTKTQLTPGIIYSFNTKPEYLIDAIVDFWNKIIENKK